ncbi:MAG: MFS transporter [Acidimicrobiales bacterium]|nr:MFS transporter [Acidimicrobiales bacterium]
MTTAEPVDGRFPYRWLVAVVFVCAPFMDLMDTTIVNVALPGPAKQFHASTDDIEWVVLGYVVALAASIPASGWLGDRFGTKKVSLGPLLALRIHDADAASTIRSRSTVYEVSTLHAEPAM